jgi:hypothetical protein
MKKLIASWQIFVQQQKGNNMAENTNTHIARLSDMLGFDPGKKDQITSEAFKEVVAEIQAERQKAVKEKAKTQLLKAMEIRDQKSKMDKEYANASKKWDKEMGNLLKQIESMLTGKPVEEEEKKEGESNG